MHCPEHFTMGRTNNYILYYIILYYIILYYIILYYIKCRCLSLRSGGLDLGTRGSAICPVFLPLDQVSSRHGSGLGQCITVLHRYLYYSNTLLHTEPVLPVASNFKNVPTFGSLRNTLTHTL